MPRAPRIVVPPTVELPPPSDNGGQDGPDYDEMTEIELSQLKLGDLGLLNNPDYRDWDWHIYRFRTRAEIAADPQGGPRELMGKRSGPIDLFEIQEQFGGGVFEFWGFFDKNEGEGKKLYKKPIIPIAGPRKRFDVPPPQTPVAVPAILSSDPALRLLERMDQRLADMARTPAPAAAAPPTLKDLADTLKTLDELRGRNAPAASGDPNTKTVETYLGLIERGIAIGSERDPSAEPAGTDWGKVIDGALPVLDRMLSNLSRARRPIPRPAGAAGPAPTTASSAVVIEDGKPEVEVSYRWTVAIESLANAIADNEPPRDFAITLEHILNKQEFGMLRVATLEQVMAEMKAAVETFPILKTEQAQTYIQALLGEIKNPSEDPGDGQ